MVNRVTLSDDELAVIQAALELSIKSTCKYIQDHGEGSLDEETKQYFMDVHRLYERFKEEYF